MLPEIAPWPAFAAGVLLAFGGLVALSQGMARHHAQVWNGSLTDRSRMLWRAGGAALLFGAFAACVLGWGVGAGLAAWLGLLTLAGLPLVVLLPYAPQTLRVLMPAAPLVGFAVFVGALIGF